MSDASQTAFGLAQVWLQGDWVTRTVALLLLTMSIITWAMIVLKGWALWRSHQQAARTDAFWHSANVDEALQQLGPQDSPFRQLAEQGREASAHHHQYADEMHGSLSASDWISLCLHHSVENSQARLQSGLSLLASIGSTAPFIGLFGTVWGIYHALMGISHNGAATIDKVAGPIGEALIMTELGLAVAIPAVLAYNALLRGNRRVIGNLRRFGHDLHAWLLTGGRSTTRRA